MRREALLRGTECYFSSEDLQASSFIVDIRKAEERNENLMRVNKGLPFLPSDIHVHVNVANFVDDFPLFSCIY